MRNTVRTSTHFECLITSDLSLVRPVLWSSNCFKSLYQFYCRVWMITFSFNKFIRLNFDGWVIFNGIRLKRLLFCQQLKNVTSSSCTMRIESRDWILCCGKCPKTLCAMLLSVTVPIHYWFSFVVEQMTVTSKQQMFFSLIRVYRTLDSCFYDRDSWILMTFCEMSNKHLFEFLKQIDFFVSWDALHRSTYSHFSSVKKKLHLLVLAENDHQGGSRWSRVNCKNLFLV